MFTLFVTFEEPVTSIVFTVTFSVGKSNQKQVIHYIFRRESNKKQVNRYIFCGDSDQ